MSNSINGVYGNYGNGYQTQMSTQQKSKIERELQYLGIPSDVISQGAEAVEEYAEQNGITLPNPQENQLQSTSIFTMADENGQNSNGY